MFHQAELNSAIASPRRGNGEARRTKGAHVYAEIKEAILAGDLPPGSPIDKAALCERLGMSRFPVSAAISRLAFERLVVVEPQHGSFVARIARDEVFECMMLRGAIEGETASMAAERRPPGLLDGLDRSLRYQAAAVAGGDVPGFYALDVGFHDAIMASLGLGHAASILDGLRARLERTRRILSATRGRMEQTQDHHVAIRDAIATGDGPAARDAMRRHLDATTQVFRDFAFDHPALFSDRP